MEAGGARCLPGVTLAGFGNKGTVYGALKDGEQRTIVRLK